MGYIAESYILFQHDNPGSAVTRIGVVMKNYILHNVWSY